MTEISIFISAKEGGKKYIEKMLKKEYDQDCYLVGDGHKYDIEEGYFEDYGKDDGSLYFSLNGPDGLYYSIRIPFDEWVYQAIRFDWFENIDAICDEKKKQIEKMQLKFKSLQNKIKKQNGRKTRKTA
jgi:hypothetical protein